MPRPPRRPKVGFYWSLDGRETKATCKLCSAMFWGYGRSNVYTSTAPHKESCPKVVAWKAEMRALGHYA